jgi:threonyl-tRNA synthetase
MNKNFGVEQELDLFSIQEKAGGGLVFWHPKGGRMRNIIEMYWKDIHAKNGCASLVVPS